MNHLSLPETLEPFRSEIEKTVAPTIRANAESQPTTLWESKVGGHPYFPKNMAYPKDEIGSPMKLLAQLNFSELPFVFPDLPTKGILQFFLRQDDDLYGADFDNHTNQEGFKIIYHEEILHDESQLISDFSFIDNAEIEEYLLPIQSHTEAKLMFTVEEEPVGFCDFQFERLLGDKIPEEYVKDGVTYDATEEYADHLDSSGHKIGGYAFFTQFDPRDDVEMNQEFLLFQLDTDDDIDCMWGDSGVGNFFISLEDLRNRNFSNVYYNWDCC